MLVLSRKVDQALRIGQDVVVRVLGIEQGRVKLGIEAPQDIAIERDELPDGTDGRFRTLNSPQEPKGRTPKA